MTDGSTPAGWYQDPTGQGDARYWNGTTWTESVNRGGQELNVSIDPTAATQAPVPGTEVQLPATTTEPAPQRSSGGTSSGVIIGLLVAALLIIVVIVVAVANDDDSDSEEEPPTTTEAGLDLDLGPSSTAAPATTG